MMGINNEIVFVEHCPPIFCRKIWYWQRRVFRRRANRPLPEISPIEIHMPAEPEPPVRNSTAANELTRTSREITPKDVPRLDKLKLTDYAVNFRNVQMPKGAALSQADLEAVFESFIQEVGAK